MYRIHTNNIILNILFLSLQWN